MGWAERGEQLLKGCNSCITDVLSRTDLQGKVKSSPQRLCQIVVDFPLN